MPKPNTWIIKLGGSLLGSPYLGDWLSVIARESANRRIVVVPGGGVFADAVRAAQAATDIDDALAHHLAMTGMRQYGEMLMALWESTEELQWATRDALLATPRAKGAWLWDPLDPSIQSASVPRDWRVTSDSLSMWLCNAISATALLLVKSIAPRTANRSAVTLAAENFIDEYFPTILSESDRVVWWLEKNRVSALSAILEGRYLCDHRISC